MQTQKRRKRKQPTNILHVVYIFTRLSPKIWPISLSNDTEHKTYVYTIIIIAIVLKLDSTYRLHLQIHSLNMNMMDGLKSTHFRHHLNISNLYALKILCFQIVPWYVTCLNERLSFAKKLFNYVTNTFFDLFFFFILPITFVLSHTIHYKKYCNSYFK